MSCRAIVEFEDARLDALELAVATRLGFELRSHKHELYGVCPKCRAH